MAVASSVHRVVEEVPAHGGPASFSDLYHRHRHAVFRWARRYCGSNAAEAEDLTHDVFMKLLQCLPEIDGERAGAWLYRVTANLAISRVRSRRSLLARLRDLFLRGDGSSHPVARLEARDAAARALALLGELPPRERVVLSMHVLDGLSQVEIAATLALSQGYVSKLLARATAALRAGGCEVDDG
jgi:RNA polymerase sigma factor (sigma-70 family)